MKKTTFLYTVFLVLVLGGVAAAEVPTGIAGLVLGKNTDEFKKSLKPETSMTLRQAPYIHELETAPIPGYRYGFLWVGNCADPGRIVRIRMKYADPSKKFYNQLLKRYKKQLGEPSEWKGDPFHIVIAWKWSFTDRNNNTISITLQHNTRDEEESLGNSVKMAMWNLIEEEKKCYANKRAQEKTEAKHTAQMTADWDLLIPQ